MIIALFLLLLRRFSKTEKQRMAIYKVLHEKTRETYSEQTKFGNVYNANIEFLMANPVIRENSLIMDNQTSLKMLKEGLTISFDEAVAFIKAEGKTRG